MRYTMEKFREPCDKLKNHSLVKNLIKVMHLKKQRYITNLYFFIHVLFEVRTMFVLLYSNKGDR